MNLIKIITGAFKALFRKDLHKLFVRDFQLKVRVKSEYAKEYFLTKHF